MIHKLEQEAGAWISIQSEREMQAEARRARKVIIKGSCESRSKALYLITRVLAVDPAALDIEPSAAAQHPPPGSRSSSSSSLQGTSSHAPHRPSPSPPRGGYQFGYQSGGGASPSPPTSLRASPGHYSASPGRGAPFCPAPGETFNFLGLAEVNGSIPEDGLLELRTSPAAPAAAAAAQPGPFACAPSHVHVAAPFGTSAHFGATWTPLAALAPASAILGAAALPAGSGLSPRTATAAPTCLPASHATAGSGGGGGSSGGGGGGGGGGARGGGAHDDGVQGDGQGDGHGDGLFDLFSSGLGLAPLATQTQHSLDSMAGAAARGALSNPRT